jgi:hypothetical protein
MNETKKSSSEVTPVTPKSNKKTLLIIGGCVLLLCCAITTVVGGYFALQAFQTAKDITITTTPSDDGSTITKAVDEIPTLTDVKNKYLSVTNYHFSGELYSDDLKALEFYGEFVSPKNDHYITTEEDGYVTEEYTIDGIHYIRENSGEWEIADEPYNSTIQRTQLLNFFKDAPASTKAVDEGTLWSFTFEDSVNDEISILYVNKETYYPAMFTYDYFSDDGTAEHEELIYTMYNDSGISLDIPLVSP